MRLFHFTLFTQNADGSYNFVRNSALGLSGDLSIDQNIWLTGGKLSLVSSGLVNGKVAGKSQSTVTDKVV